MQNAGEYGESQGEYGRQGGYRAINYTDRFGNPGGESEYQGSRENRENQRYGQQQDWRSDWRSQESGWRPEQERMSQYREGQPERSYRQWGNDTETDEMNRGRWEGGGRWESGRWESGIESNREPERQRSNVTRFGQRREGQGQSGMQSGMQSGSQSGYSSGMMQGRQSFAGRGPQGYKRSDERITEDINEELTQDPQLDASDVNVEVRNGEVVLKGTVPDRESKRRAEEIAECCSGVKDVMNQLRVKREESSESENASRRDKEDKRNKVAS